MENGIQNYLTAVQAVDVEGYTRPLATKRLLPQPLYTELPDTLSLGTSGQVSEQDAVSVVYERALNRLKNVVADAREALGIPEGAELDTSAEATATRIADFALGAFDKWVGNHTDLADDDARQQFANFIGGAIKQGVEEARSILGSLQALSPTIEDKITSIHDIVSQRLDDFVNGTAEV